MRLLIPFCLLSSGCGLLPLNFVIDDLVVEGSQVHIAMNSTRLSCDRYLRCQRFGGEITQIELEPSDILVAEITQGSRWVYRAQKSGTVKVKVKASLGGNDDSTTATIEVAAAAQTRLLAGERHIQRLLTVPEQTIKLEQEVTDIQGRRLLTRDYLGVFGDERVRVEKISDSLVGLTAVATLAEVQLRDGAQKPVITVTIADQVNIAALELTVPVTTGLLLYPVTVGIAENGDAVCGLARVRMESLTLEVCGKAEDRQIEVPLCSPQEMLINAPGVCVVQTTLISDTQNLQVADQAGVAPPLDRYAEGFEE